MTGSNPARKSARKLAMDWLSRREHTLDELRAKLASREIDLPDIEATVTSLADEGLVSDERFAESFVASRLRRGQGPVRIRIDMKRKGVSAELIRTHVDEADEDWVALAIEVRSKRFGNSPPAVFREKARQSRFLQYRGFTTEQIQAALAGSE